MKKELFTSNIESRKAFIINALYFSIIAALFYLVVKYALPALFPIIIAIIIAAMAQWPVKKLKIKKKFLKTLITILVVILTYAIFIAIISVIGKSLISELTSFKNYLFEKIAEPMWLEKVTDKITAATPHIFKTYVSNALNSISEILKKMVNPDHQVSSAAGGKAFNVGGLVSASAPKFLNAVKSIPSAFFGFVITIVLTCFIAIDYDELKNHMLSFLPKDKQKAFVLMQDTLRTSLGKIFKSYAMILFITFCELYISFNIIKWAKIFDGKYSFVLALIIALLDILPILGTGTFLGPWALYCFIVQDYKLGVALIVIYIVITVIRQIIEPKLIANQFDLNPAISLIAMFVGTKLIGFIGLFLFPMILFSIKILRKEGYLGGNSEEVIKEKNIDNEV